MQKTVLLFTILFAFLTVFATTVSAAGSGSGVSDTAYQGPLVLLSLLTLAIFIYLPLRDNN